MASTFTSYSGRPISDDEGLPLRDLAPIPAIPGTTTTGTAPAAPTKTNDSQIGEDTWGILSDGADGDFRPPGTEGYLASDGTTAALPPPTDHAPASTPEASLTCVGTTCVSAICCSCFATCAAPATPVTMQVFPDRHLRFSIGVPRFTPSTLMRHGL
ncbi:hypothetical protein Vretimale_17185 [Volvox reticuliferus]|uniref:Uncharacterized protein n=1 Tax=Volvox reticuliferus TaxID=1737510 RepID=A0A8J4GUQ4_9CHLO|nr:hypothetical protein Vretifemale_16638 [Volvox reticuliferus]GIM14300.1 hypothetical protein Vretimale_17185 [Volvox reticuliferus]